MLFFSYFGLNKLKMEERKTIMMTLMMMIDVKDDESDDVVGDDDNDFDEWRVSITIMTKRPIQTTIKRISHYKRQFSYANILAHSNILPISQGLVHVSFSA